MEYKTFKNRKEAKEFSENTNGVIEGPFMDERLNTWYTVFYSAKKED